jgi:hypothetical protein
MSKLTRENAILPFVPKVNLSGKEGHIVQLEGDGTVGLWYASSGERPFGVIVHGTNTDERASIALCAGGLSGTVKLKLSAAVTAVGQELQVENTATVSPDAGTGSRTLVAQALETGVEGEMIEAVLFRPVALS